MLISTHVLLVKAAVDVARREGYLINKSVLDLWDYAVCVQKRLLGDKAFRDFIQEREKRSWMYAELPKPLEEGVYATCWLEDSIENRERKSREEAIREAVNLLRLARALWVQNGDNSKVAIGSQKLKGDRAAAMYLAGCVMRTVHDAICNLNNLPECDNIHDEVKKGFNDANETALRKISKVKRERTPEKALKGAAYYSGLTMGYVIKNADQTIAGKYKIARAVYKIASPALLGFGVLAGYTLASASVVGTLLPLLVVSSILVALKLIQSAVSRLGEKIKWAYGVLEENLVV